MKVSVSDLFEEDMDIDINDALLLLELAVSKNSDQDPRVRKVASNLLDSLKALFPNNH